MSGFLLMLKRCGYAYAYLFTFWWRHHPLEANCHESFFWLEFLLDSRLSYESL